MSRLFRLLIQFLFSIIAFVVMISIILTIAYLDELYTPPKDESPFLAITGVTLLDGTRLDLLEKVIIVIHDGEIIKIQPGTPPDGALVMYEPDGYVLPALIDAAVYFQAPAGTEVIQPMGEWLWEITRSTPEHRRALDKAGVAIVQDLGSELDSGLRMRAQLDDGDVAGPKLVTTGPIMTVAGGCPGIERYPYRLDSTTRIVNSPEEAEEFVEMLADWNVDGISVCYSSRKGAFSLMDPDVLRAIIGKAKGNDLRVMVETSSYAEARQAVAAGATALVGGVSLEGERIDQGLLDLMAASGTYYIPTLASIEAVESNGPESLSNAMDNVQLVSRAGIPIVAGTGTAGRALWYGSSLVRELELLVEAGLTPKQAILASTGNAADLLDVPDAKLVQEGMEANLIVVKGNPLEDIRVLRDVRMFISRGRLVENQD
ncbi:MAG: amidohydrolase family protein [Anaerolineales bacterium]|nr:amidohydrolase family protein [Anaerolineales bacterium]